MTLDAELRRILASSFVLRVSHTGRRSGQPRILETTYYWDGRDRICLSGYPGKRDWVANMNAHPCLTLYTVEGAPWIEAPVQARVVRDRRERTNYIMRYVARWTGLPGAERRIIAWAVRAARLNQALRLPWWGPFYLMRCIFDHMPCVELTLTGPPVRRAAPPPEPTPGPGAAGRDTESDATSGAPH